MAVRAPSGFFVAPFNIQDFEPRTPKKPTNGPKRGKQTGKQQQQQQPDVGEVRYRSAIRLRSVWESIAERYSTPQPLDDEVDLTKLSIVEDKGYLKLARARPIGFFGLPGERVKLGIEGEDSTDESSPRSDGWETAEESADELGQWDEGQCAISYDAREARRQQSERLDDLRAFLDAENSARRDSSDALVVPQHAGNLILDRPPSPVTESESSDDGIDSFSSPQTSQRQDESVPSPTKKRRLSFQPKSIQLATPPASSPAPSSPVPVSSVSREKTARPSSQSANRQLATPPASTSSMSSPLMLHSSLTSIRVAPERTPKRSVPPPTPNNAKATTDRPRSTAVAFADVLRRKKEMTPVVIIEKSPITRLRSSSQKPKSFLSTPISTSLPTPPLSSSFSLPPIPPPHKGSSRLQRGHTFSAAPTTAPGDESEPEPDITSSPSTSAARRKSASIMQRPKVRSTTEVSDSDSDSFDAPPGGRSRSVSVVRRSVSVSRGTSVSAANRRVPGRQRWTLASVEEVDEPDGADPMDLLK
jgi:hypothetical protein